MNRFAKAIGSLDWQSSTTQLNQEGFAVLPGFLNADATGAKCWSSRIAILKICSSSTRNTLKQDSSAS